MIVNTPILDAYLPAYQGRGEADCAGGTGAHRGR